MTPFLRGVWLAYPTMLLADDKLDEETTRRVARFLVNHSVDGLWSFQGVGEGVLLEHEVRIRS